METQILNKTVEHFTKLLEEFEMAGQITAAFVNSDSSDKQDERFHQYISVKVVGDHLNDMVGFHGKNMEAIQAVVSLMLSREFETDIRVLLEVNDYREKRQKYLENVAQRAVMEVQSSGQEVELPPMKPFERRIIHMTLKEISGIETESVGEGEDRRIVIKKI